MADSEDRGEWLTTEEACRFKGWSRSTLFKKVAQGLVKKYKTPGQAPMYKRSELTIDAIMARAVETGKVEASGSRA